MSDRHVTVRGVAYRLARLGPADMRPLVPFFRDVFHRTDFTLDWLRGKYAAVYDGASAFSCVAFTEQGEVAATFGMLPWPIRFGSHTEVAAQAVDAATHQAHRRRGLFSLLAQMARDECASDGAAFLFAFPHPNGDSYPGFIRNLGYRHLDDLVEYRRSIRTPWIERIAKRAGGPWHRGYLREVQRVLAPYAASNPVIGNSLIAEGFAASDHTAGFHAHKAFAGNRVLATDGGRVWLKIRHGMLIGDLEATSDRDMDATVRTLEHVATRLGVHEIVFQSSKGTRFSRYFGTRFPDIAVPYGGLSGHPLDNPTGSTPLYLRRSRQFLATGSDALRYDRAEYRNEGVPQEDRAMSIDDHQISHGGEGVSAQRKRAVRRGFEHDDRLFGEVGGRENTHLLDGEAPAVALGAILGRAIEHTPSNKREPTRARGPNIRLDGVAGMGSPGSSEGWSVPEVEGGVRLPPLDGAHQPPTAFVAEHGRVHPRHILENHGHFPPTLRKASGAEDRHFVPVAALGDAVILPAFLQQKRVR